MVVKHSLEDRPTLMFENNIGVRQKLSFNYSFMFNFSTVSNKTKDIFSQKVFQYIFSKYQLENVPNPVSK